MDSSVPGTTVVMREVPSFAAGPTARLCQSNGYCLARTGLCNYQNKGSIKYKIGLNNLNIVAPSGENTCYNIENSRDIIHKN
jgi:hypothetical protein